MQNFEVIVELKPEVLDAQGRAIRESLRKMGVEELADVRVNKRFVLQLDMSDQALAMAKAERIASDFLANPVSETFSIKRLQK